MNFFIKQKLWFFIAIFFIVVTITLLLGLWHTKSKHSNHKKGEENYRMREDKDHHDSQDFSLTDYLAKELDFTAVQKEKLAAINDGMESLKDSLSEQNEISKDLFSTLLYSYNPNKKTQDSLISCMSNFTALFNRTRIEHVDKIKALCNDEQKKNLAAA